VALKSIAAYRTGLEITDPAEAAAASAFTAVREAWERAGAVRLAHADLLHYCLRRAFVAAAEVTLPAQLPPGLAGGAADLRPADWPRPPRSCPPGVPSAGRSIAGGPPAGPAAPWRASWASWWPAASGRRATPTRPPRRSSPATPGGSTGSRRLNSNWQIDSFN